MFFRRIGFALRSAELDALRFFPRKSFFCAQADEIAFDFCRKSERKCKHLAGNIIPESVIVLDAPDKASFFHTDAEYLHYHKKASAKSGQFGADNYVSLADASEQFPEAALAVSLGATDCFLYPSVDAEMLTSTETINFELLILNSLLITADSDIAIYHVNLPPLIYNT